MSKFTFNRKGHPARAGTAAVIRKDMAILFDSVRGIGKPELFTEMAMCLCDEMEALGITLDVDIEFPRHLAPPPSCCNLPDIPF